MTMRDFKEYQLMNGVTPVAVTSSTDATPVVVTATSHGLTTGDQVFIFGHTTNIAANGIYSVTVVTANTFSIQDVNTGANIAGSGGGAGSSGILVRNPKVLLVNDAINIVLGLSTAGTATTTLKFFGSMGKSDGSMPNFGAAASATNPWNFIQVINLDTAAAVNGATGEVVAGTDISKNFEVNINGLKFLLLAPVTWTQGSITSRAILTINS